MKLPGGVEVRSQAAMPERQDEDGPIVTLTADRRAEIDVEFENLAQQHQLTEEARQPRSRSR